jgi:hypothetical protein
MSNPRGLVAGIDYGAAMAPKRDEVQRMPACRSSFTKETR